MSAPLFRPMTRGQFLAWEERQELRHEFDGSTVRAMTGGSAAHAIIQRNLVQSLANRLPDGPCQPFGSDMKIEVAHGYRYPDAFVVCSPVAMAAKVVIDPVVIFEVVSPSSVAIDFSVKNAEYHAVPSVRRYVVLQQETAAAVVFSRNGDRWETELVAGSDALLRLPEIGVSVSFTEIYRGVAFEPGTDASA